MHFMNEPEIDMYLERHARHPVLGHATRILSALRDVVNENSDGWCYWKAPVRAAEKLMLLIEGKTEPTVPNLTKALTPIKSFCTRKGLELPLLYSSPAARDEAFSAAS